MYSIDFETNDCKESRRKLVFCRSRMQIWCWNYWFSLTLNLLMVYNIRVATKISVLQLQLWSRVLHFVHKRYVDMVSMNRNFRIIMRLKNSMDVYKMVLGLRDKTRDLQWHRQTSSRQICVNLNPISARCNSDLQTCIFALYWQSNLSLITLLR
jgi:hypothetical protein